MKAKLKELLRNILLTPISFLAIIFLPRGIMCRKRDLSPESKHFIETGEYPKD